MVPAPVKSNIFDSSIDALGDRGLGRARIKFAMPKENLSETLARFRYNIDRLGVADWWRCTALNLARTLRRGRAARHDARMLRVTAKTSAVELARARPGS